VDTLEDIRSLDNCPIEMLLALNKAKTVSWRMGIGWTLVSKSREVLTCNGALFNAHIQPLIEDIKSHQNAKKLYISYCPTPDDLFCTRLLAALSISNLVELNVCTSEIDKFSVINLFSRTAIPTTQWRSDQDKFCQSAGIAWVRSTRRPWINLICSSNLVGSYQSIHKVSELLGVTNQISLKGLESSVLYMQNDCDSVFNSRFDLVRPKLVRSTSSLINCLYELSVATVSIVTIVCDPIWLNHITRMNLANEVTYFQALRNPAKDSSTRHPVIDYLEKDQWIVNSFEVMGNLMQIVLQIGYLRKAEKNTVDKRDTMVLELENYLH